MDVEAGPVVDLRLRIVQEDSRPERVETRPMAGGRDLLAEARRDGDGKRSGPPPYAGVRPRYVLGDDMPLLAADGREIRLARAGCGEESCCGALYVTVRAQGGHIVWAGWRDPASDVELPEFRFDARQYEVEVRRATADRAWEKPREAVARQLEARLRRRTDWLERYDCEVEYVWDVGGAPDRVDVILLHPRVRLTDGPFVQFCLAVPLTGEEPAALETRLTAGDPREAGEVCGGSHDCEETLGYARSDLARPAGEGGGAGDTRRHGDV